MNVLDAIEARRSYRGKFKTAPAAICVLSQKINAYRDKCFAVQDYSAAIENMLLAVFELGYQSCWYEGHITDDDRICDKMARILNVPDDYEIVCFLPIRIADENAAAPKRKALRKELGSILFRERNRSAYGEKDETVCRNMLSRRFQEKH